MPKVASKNVVLHLCMFYGTNEEWTDSYHHDTACILYTAKEMLLRTSIAYSVHILYTSDFSPNPHHHHQKEKKVKWIWIRWAWSSRHQFTTCNLPQDQPTVCSWADAFENLKVEIYITHYFVQLKIYKLLIYLIIILLHQINSCQKT